jgi:hypothetical protein
MSGNQVGYFYEPAERGRLCVIRFMAPHYTGGGEVVARNVELELAKTMCAALNSYASSQAEIERLRAALTDLLAANDAVQMVLCDGPEVPGFDPMALGRAQVRVTEAEILAREALSGSKE